MDAGAPGRPVGSGLSIPNYLDQAAAGRRALRLAPHGTSVGAGPAPTPGVADAVASVRLPLHLSWSAPDRTYRLADRRERARLYGVVLREGGPDDIRPYVDGVLLVDMWDEIVLPAGVRAAWQPVGAAALAGAS